MPRSGMEARSAGNTAGHRASGATAGGALHGAGVGSTLSCQTGFGVCRSCLNLKLSLEECLWNVPSVEETTLSTSMTTFTTSMKRISRVSIYACLVERKTLAANIAGALMIAIVGLVGSLFWKSRKCLLLKIRNRAWKSGSKQGKNRSCIYRSAFVPVSCFLSAIYAIYTKLKFLISWQHAQQTGMKNPGVAEVAASLPGSFT